jgi:hypothetical protein
MSDKKGKLAPILAASCGGCEISVLAINEKNPRRGHASILSCGPASWTARSANRENGRSIHRPLLFNGGIRTSEQEYMARYCGPSPRSSWLSARAPAKAASRSG